MSYPDDIQVSIELGWFPLTDGAFLPERAVTPAERNVIFSKVTATLSEQKDLSGDSVYAFKSSVLVLPSDTEVRMEENGALRLVNYSGEAMEEGVLFGMDYDGMPLAWIAGSVTRDGEDLLVEAESASAEEAFDELDANGSLEVDWAQMNALSENAEIFYIVGGSEAKDYEDGTLVDSVADINGEDINGFMIGSEVCSAGDISVELGMFKLKGNLKITDFKPTFKVKKDYAYVSASFKIKVNGSFKGDLAKLSEYAEDLAKIPVAPGIYYCPAFDMELSGEVQADYVESVTLGICYENKGFRIDRSFKKDSFTVTATAKGKLGYKVGLKAEMMGLKASITASAGVAAEYKKVKYKDDLEPVICEDINVWFYAKIEGKAEFKMGVGKASVKYELAKATIDIYDKDNSPTRVAYHIEDGVQTPFCTNPERFKLGNDVSAYPGYNGERVAGYFSPINSKYYYNGKSSSVSDGTNTYTLYAYTLDNMDKATITAYKGSAKNVFVPDTLDGYEVVAIGTNAFKDNTRLESVTLPDSVTKIWYNAFRGCQKLSSVNLPERIRELGSGAFYGCKSLTAIRIPKSLTSILLNSNGAAVNNGIFENSGLKEVTFEEGITQIPARLFYKCGSLEEITIPDTVTSIGGFAFYGATGLKRVELSDNLISIGASTFEDNTKLESVTIPDSVTEIWYNAFDGCQKLSSINLPERIRELGSGAFYGCKSLTAIRIPKSLTSILLNSNTAVNNGIFENSGLKEVTFEEGITQIPARLFYKCGNLEEITIPDTVTSIGGFAFYGATGLKEITLSANLTVIGENAFNGCSSLTEVVLPDSVTKIGSAAFRECQKLSSINLPDRVGEWGYGVFYGCKSLTAIRIPKSLTSVQLYNNGISATGTFENSGLREVTFEEGITQIPANLFALCGSIEEITIPDTVTSIGSYAFYKATGLKEITLSANLTSIGDDAFCGAYSLKRITIPAKLSVLPKYIFDGCASLESAELPEGLTEIWDYAFRGCSSLKEIDIPDTVTSMGEGVFYGCVSLETVHLPAGRQNITTYTFYNCKALKNINFPDTLIAIRSYAFYNCDALTALSLPAGLTTIETYAFYDCDALESAVMRDGVTTLGTYAFAHCDALKDVSLSAGLTGIPAYAFYQCGALESMVLPYRIASIGNNAFANDTKLSAITIPRATTSFGSDLFSYPGKMTIYGVAGTQAETYAKNNGIVFESIDVPATDAAFDKAKLTLVKGASDTLVLTVTPANCTDIVNWKSSDTSIVTVTDAGVVKGVAIGEAKIRAMFGESGEVAAVCDVTVVQPVTSVSMNKTSVTLEGGNTFQLTASVSPSTAFDRTVTWASSNETVATVTKDGLVTALAKGSAKITATANDGSGKVATCTVTVSSTAHIVSDWRELESKHNYDNGTNEKWFYTLENAENLQITFGEETSLEEDADYLYIYAGNGTLVGKYTGTELAGTTVSVDGDTVCIKLIADDVVNRYGFRVANLSAGQKIIELQSIALSKSALTLQIGEESQPLTVTYYPENTTVPKRVEWTSGDETIATVQNGVVTGAGAGTTTVTATAAGRTAVCRVTVKDAQGGGENDEPEGDIWIAPVQDHIYTGKAITPSVQVYDGERLLQPGTDYTVKYRDHVKAGEASILITGKGNYTHSVTKTFRILPRDLSSDEICADDIAAAYTGKKQRPIPVLTDGGTKLKAIRDYDIFYASSGPGAYTEEGTYSIVVSGQGNYTGERTLKFRITKGKLTDKLSVSKIAVQNWTGEEVKPPVTVKDGKKELTEGVDYSIRYANHVDVGTASVIITGMGEYCGVKRVNFRIAGASLGKAAVTGIRPLVYSGEPLTQDEEGIRLEVAGKELVRGRDYRISYSDHIRPGKKAAIIFTGINQYKGSVLKKTFTISAYDISADPQDKMVIDVAKTAAYSKGGAVPELSVKFDGKELTKGVDYTVKCSDNKAVGAGTNGRYPTVVIKGKGSFCGVYTAHYQIRAKDLSELTDRMTAADKVFTGKAGCIPTTVAIEDTDGKKLKAGTDYTLSYTYADSVTLADGSFRMAGDEVLKTDILPENARICVRATAVGGNYCGLAETEYRIVQKTIAKAKVTVEKQTYSGRPVVLKKEDVTVMIDGKRLTSDEFEILESTYKNNVKKGTASVTIRGCGPTYGGTKKITFKIVQKEIHD